MLSPRRGTTVDIEKVRGGGHGLSGPLGVVAFVRHGLRLLAVEGTSYLLLELGVSFLINR